MFLALKPHLPALCVILPLLAAPVCLLLRRATTSWAVAVLTSVAMLLCAVLMAVAGSGEVIEYSFGNWDAPYGIVYRIDALTVPFLLLLAGTATAVLLYARDHSGHEIPADRMHLMYLAVLLHVCGLAGVISTGDIFNMFVFIEIASLSSYALLAMGPRREALKAAFRYLIQGSIGATFILIGTGYMYAMTGTLNMADMATRLADLETTRTVYTAYGFLTIGFAIKFAMFPLHFWLPGAYRFAPTAVAALFAATGTKIYLAAWMRVSFTLFDYSHNEYLFGLAPILTVAAALAIAAGTAGALRQQHLRGILANSTIAHIGYMMLGIAAGGIAGITAALVTMYGHGLLKATMFLAAGRLQAATNGSDMLHDLRGLGHRMPWTTATIVTAGLGLIGIPVTVGFIGKWQLGTALATGGNWFALALLIAGSLGAAGYIYRIIRVLLEEQAPADKAPGCPRGTIGTLVLLSLATLIIAFGIDASPLNEWAGQAARLLLGEK